MDGLVHYYCTKRNCFHFIWILFKGIKTQDGPEASLSLQLFFTSFQRFFLFSSNFLLPLSIFLLPFSNFLLLFSIFLLYFSILFTFLHLFFTSVQHFFYFPSQVFYFLSPFFYFPSDFFFTSLHLFFTSLYTFFFFPSWFFLFPWRLFFTSIQTFFSSLSPFFTSLHCFLLPFSIFFYFPSPFFVLLFGIFPPSVFLLPFSIFQLPFWNMIEKNIKTLCLVQVRLKQIRNVIAKFRNSFDASEKNVFKEKSIILLFQQVQITWFICCVLCFGYYSSIVLYYCLIFLFVWELSWGNFNRRNRWGRSFFAENVPEHKAVTKWWIVKDKL